MTGTQLSAARITRIGVVGTGHGVGATTVAAAIAAGMRATGARISALKPISCGSLADAERLRAATGGTQSLELVAPVRLADPLAPLVAARRARATIDLDALDHALATSSATSDAIVVDAPGPLLTPITESESVASLFARWGLGLVIVAPNTRDAIANVRAATTIAAAHSLVVHAVVLTTLTRPGDVIGIDRGAAPARTNQAVLKELLRSVPVIALPHTTTPGDPTALAALARDFATRATFTRPV